MDTLDIIREIERDEGLRAQLRAVLLGDEFLGLPPAVRELSKKVDKLMENEERVLSSLDQLIVGQEKLFAGQDSLRSEVGKLSQILGGTIEDDARQLIEVMIERHQWILKKKAAPVEVNGEIDVVAEVVDENNIDIGIICEAKTRLKREDVKCFKKKVNSLADKAKLPKDRLAYLYGLSIYDGVEDEAKKLGLGILGIRGELIPAVKL